MSTSNSGRVPTDTELWMPMASLVFDHAGPWRQQVAEVTGMPFSRFRALRRLEYGPLSGTELATRMDVDAAAVSVAIGDLAARGFVTKTLDPEDSRRKIVELTEDGRRLLHSLTTLEFPAPLFDALDDDDRRDLLRILGTLKEANA